MTHVIAVPCLDVKNSACVAVCPVECIHECDRMLVIDPEECIDCGACVSECPVDAIFLEVDLPAEWKQFSDFNARWRIGGSPGVAAALKTAGI